jgi:hypothetical protein
MPSRIPVDPRAPNRSIRQGIGSVTEVRGESIAKCFGFLRVEALAPSLFDTGLTKLAPPEMKAALVDGAAFPRRMGHPEEYARLARAIVETPILNGSTIRLDAAQRFAPK